MMNYVNIFFRLCFPVEIDLDTADGLFLRGLMTFADQLDPVVERLTGPETLTNRTDSIFERGERFHASYRGERFRGLNQAKTGKGCDTEIILSSGVIGYTLF